MLGSTAAAENVDPREPTVILSHALWKRSFNADPSVIGRQVVLSGIGYTVIAIMPAGFRFPIQSTPQVDLWMPLARFNPVLANKRDARLSEVLARLRPNVPLRQAQAEMDTIAAQLRKDYPKTNNDIGIRIVPALEQVTGGTGHGLLIIFASVGALLLIACTNIANLHLVRAVARQREVSIRASLGASRVRIGSQLITEGVILAMIGGAAGLLVASFGMQVLRTLIPAGLPRVDEISLDSHVLVFTFLLAVVTGLLFSVMPAWHASRAGLAMSLQENRQTTTGGRGLRRISKTVVVGEIALAMMLLIGAGLLIKTFWRLQHPGLDWKPRDVLTFEIILPSEKYKDPKPAFQEIQRRLLDIPGVIAASTGLQLPDRGGPVINDDAPFFEVEGQPISPDQRQRATIVITQPGYLRALGVPLIKGREFEQRDMSGTAHVAIINESLARTYFANADPVGKRLRLDSWRLWEPRVQEIIGVAADVTHNTFESAQPVVYVPLPEVSIWESHFVVRTAGNPLGFVNRVESAVHSFDANEPIDDVQTLDQRLSSSIARERFTALLVGIFSTLGFTLAAVGLYGVVSYTVAQRRREIGIRIAIGAEEKMVLSFVFREGMAMALIGILLGLAGAIAQTRLMGALLFGVSATDPITFAAVTLLLIVIASIASLIPAYRAAKTDPVAVLRQ
jgi:putative ABC transport system permease protein